MLLLARDRAAPRSFLADLALYFVVSNAVGLLILLAEGALDADAFFPAFLLWLPGSLPATGPARRSARGCPRPASGG